MRRFNICEERGSGIDKVIQQVEVFQLPAPLIEAPPGSTRISLFAHKPLSEMDKSERIWACYLHALFMLCFQPAGEQRFNSGTLWHFRRQRYGIPVAQRNNRQRAN